MERKIMRRALIAVAVTALMAGLVAAPVTEQTAMAGFSGLNDAGTTPSGNPITIVRHGGGGGGHMGGGHGHMGGGHYGGGHAFRGGGGHYGGAHFRGGGHYAYRGGGHRYGHYYGGPRHYYGGKNKHYAYKNHGRYYRGRYYRYGWWPYVGVGVGYGYYGYGGCAWLRRQALATGSSYWWQRYYDCIYY
jgi:hypothetical protein